MNNEDNLLGKADQLMRRHRSFVASNPANESGEEQDVDEDLPLLTEVVTAGQGTQIDSAQRLSLDQLLVAERAEMLREFERWLDEQLPQVVTSAMDGITDRLLALITRRARAELLPRLEAIALQTGKREMAGEDGGGKDGGQPV